jgi:hypothetical protein
MFHRCMIRSTIRATESSFVVGFGGGIAQGALREQARIKTKFL